MLNCLTIECVVRRDGDRSLRPTLVGLTFTQSNLHSTIGKATNSLGRNINRYDEINDYFINSSIYIKLL